MAILNAVTEQVGQSGLVPKIIYIQTNNTVAEVTAAGFLNVLPQKFNISLSENDIALVSTKVSPSATATTVSFFNVGFSGGNWSLTSATSSGTVNAGTANQMAYYAATGDAVSGLASANRAVLTTGATGVPVMTPLATNGQLLIGSTAGVPAAATLTAGSGISITNGSNSITIAASGGAATQLAITNDVATNAAMYPVWVTANTGNLPPYVSSTKLAFNPSTGTLTSTRLSTPLMTDANGNESLSFTSTASAVNYLDLANAATAGAPTLAAAGDDTDVDVTVALKGNGSLNIKTPTITGSGGGIKFFENPSFGTNYLWILPDSTSIASNRTINIPSDSSTPIVLTGSTQTLTNKTLTAARIANAGFLADANGNEQIVFNTTASAVNQLSVTNAATGDSPVIAASGSDSNVILTLNGQGDAGVSIQGTRLGDNAATLAVGQLISATYVSGVALTSGVTAQVAVITLTAGDWDVWGYVQLSPAGGTTTSSFTVAIDASSATLTPPTDAETAAYASMPYAVAAGVSSVAQTGTARISRAGATFFYLNVNASFAVSTMTAAGQLFARRRR